MDADQRPMIPDATIDRELQALLAIEPSPEFGARVRTRLGDDPVRRVWWFPRARVAAAAAAVVIVAVVVTRSVSEAPVIERSAESIAQPESQPVAFLKARPFQPLLPVLPVLPVLPLQPLLPSHEPDILIDARESSALRALIRRVSDGQIDLGLIVSAAPGVMDLTPLEDVSIEPIVIVPLEEGARP
jgi:hypothetical protein